MITTKRQIRTNEDRYIRSDEEMSTLDADIRLGRDVPETAFADIKIAEAPVREERAVYDFSQLKPVDKMPVIEKNTVEEKPLYTTRETINDLPSRPEKERTAHKVEDVMPSIKTLEAAERKANIGRAEDSISMEQSVARTDVAPRTNLTPKMKVMLFVSLAIALVLAIAVIATGVSISNATAESAALARQITEKQMHIVEQEVTLADLTSESTILEEATARGMVKAGENQYTASRAEKSDYPEATPHTNAFDQFCDWLAGLIN